MNVADVVNGESYWDQTWPEIGTLFTLPGFWTVCQVTTTSTSPLRNSFRGQSAWQLHLYSELFLFPIIPFRFL
ncbi:hypothetical protein GDO86_018695 [Hymenochirus boettgeri]|uniref:Uncharacterized protein n=1 Tax=Hymenochirus boettgeri TaxID=247094 RepID=A0A8T2IMT3_9PIPI|nr:hypothetical protein GDO86_018695 [Hymenochirus boettgeri]